jgi:hypothetical protein
VKKKADVVDMAVDDAGEGDVDRVRVVVTTGSVWDVVAVVVAVAVVVVVTSSSSSSSFRTVVVVVVVVDARSCGTEGRPVTVIFTSISVVDAVAVAVAVAVAARTMTV